MLLQLVLWMKTQNNTGYFNHTLRVNTLPVPLRLVITSFQSLTSRRTSVSRLPTLLTDIPASLARPTWPLTQSTAFWTNTFTFWNKGWASITVDSFTSIRALLDGPIFLVPSWVRRLELLREEVHVTLAKLVGATGTARSGAARSIFRIWTLSVRNEKKREYVGRLQGKLGAIKVMIAVTNFLPTYHEM